MSIKTAYQQALDTVKNRVGTWAKKYTTPIDYNNLVAKPQPSVSAQQNFQKTFTRDYNNWQAQQAATQQQNKGNLISVFKNVRDYFNPTKDTNPTTPKVDNFWTAKVPVGLDRVANVLPYGIKAIKPTLKQQVGVLLKQPKAFGELAKTIDSTIPDPLKTPLYMLNPGVNALATTLKLDKAIGSPIAKTYNAIAEAESKLGTDIIVKNQAVKNAIQAEKEKKLGPTPQHETFIENLSDPRYLADVLGYQAPQFVTDLGVQAAIAYATGGAGALGKVASFLPLYLSSATESYMDAKEAALANGMSEEEAERIALQVQAGVGVVNGVLDKIGLDSVLGKVFTKGADQAVVKAAQGTLVKNVLGRLGEVSKASLTEGLTEGLQQVVLNSAAKLYYDHQRDWFEGVPENAFFGFLMGGLAKFGIEVPQEYLEKVKVESKLKTATQSVLGLSAPDYNSPEDFAENEFGATKDTQIGFVNPNKITTTIAPNDANVQRKKAVILMGTNYDPVVVTKDDQGQLTVTDQESADTLAAYQSAGRIIPIINQSDIKLPELLTVEQVYNQEQESKAQPQKEETVQSLITEDMENFNPDKATQIRDKGEISTEPLGTEFNTDKKDAQALIKSTLNNRQLEDLQVITNNSKEMINPKTGELVWGKYYDAVITVLEQNGKVQDSTLYHEAFHYYADKLADHELYASALQQAKAEGMMIGRKEYSDPAEYLADGFAMFVQGRGTFTGKVLAFFRDMMVQLRSMIGKANAIELMYYNAVKGNNEVQIGDTQVAPAFRDNISTTVTTKIVDALIPFIDKFGLSKYTVADYDGFKTALSSDGKTGYAIKPDGDLISVFNAGEKGYGAFSVEDAIENGAVKLDCFDGKLPAYYSMFGFEEIGRDSWNDEYAPDNWDYEKYGRPDIVYMKLNPEKYAEYKENGGNADSAKLTRPVFERNFRSDGRTDGGVGTQVPGTETAQGASYRTAEQQVGERLASPEQKSTLTKPSVFYSMVRYEPGQVGFSSIQEAIDTGNHANVAQVTKQIADNFDHIFFPDAQLTNQEVLGVYYGTAEGSNRIVINRPEDINVGLYKALVFAKYNKQDSVFTQDFSNAEHPNLHLFFNEDLTQDQQQAITGAIAELTNGAFPGGSIVPGENRIQVSYIPNYVDFDTDAAIDIFDNIVLQLKSKGYQFDFEYDASQNGLIESKDYDNRIREISSQDGRVAQAVNSSWSNPSQRRSVEQIFAEQGHTISNPDYFWASITGTPGPQYRTVDTKQYPTRDFIKYQDTNKLEYLNKKGFTTSEYNPYYHEKIENAGDIGRELSMRGELADPNYVFEKINKLKKVLNPEEDPFGYRWYMEDKNANGQPVDLEKQKAVVDEYIQNYLAYPEEKLTPIELKARDLTIAVAKKDVPLAKQLLGEFEAMFREQYMNKPQYRGTGEFVKASDEEVDTFDSQEYVKEEIQRRETEENKASEPATVVDKIHNVLKTIRYSMVDRFSPIEDVLTKVERKYKLKILPTNDFRYQVDRVLRFSAIADQFAKKNGLIEAIQDNPDMDMFEQYLIARHALDLETNHGIETGRDLRRDDMLTRQQEERFRDYTKLIDNYRVSLLDYMVDANLISADLRQMLLDKYPYYVPSQRVFDEIEAARNEALSPRQVASIAQQTVIREIQGSERAIKNPLSEMLLQTRRAFEQGERNKAARMVASYKDLPGNPFDITPLRTAENVLARMDILGDIKTLGDAKRPLERILKTRKRWLRSLMSELNALNKKGLHLALKSVGKDYTADLTTKLETGTIPNLQFGEGDLRDIIVATTGADNPDVEYKLIESKLGNKEVKQIINNLIKLDRKGLEMIRRKIARRDVKLNNLLNEIETIKTVVDDINAKRAELFNEEKLLRDAKTRGKATISTIKNGVKEIYEIDPEIEKVVKHMDQKELDVVTKTLHYFTRILQLGATGYNIPFVVFNAAKDQITALINSDTGLKTSMANPGNFVNALTAAFTHNGVYDEWVASGAGGTMYDMTRKNAPQSLEAIRSRKDLKSKIAYTATHPQSWLGALENIIGRGEELTRIQQYLNKKQESLSQGRTSEDATILAANASRFNTANFARAGSFARVANYYIPFFNAGIQGSRALSRALVTRPGPTILKLASLIYLPMAATTLWNLGDEERKKVYDDIQDWEKEDNFIIVLDGASKNSKGQWENVIKVPIPPGLSNLASLVRRPLEWYAGQDPVTAKEIFDDLVQAGTSFDLSSYQTFLNSTVPQATKPLVEIGTNTDLFTGKKIIPQYMENYKPEEQKYDWTSGTAIGIGKALNMSPIMVEKEISTIGGGVGKQLLNIVDRTAAKAGAIPETSVGGESAAANVLNRTIRARGGDQANDIYEALNESDAEKRQDRSQTVKAIKDQISVNQTTLQTLTAGMDSESANSVIDAAFEKKLRESMDATERAIQSSTKAEREMLGKKDPALIPIINLVTQKENASKLQAKIAKESIKSSDISGLSESVAEKQKRSDQFTAIHELEKAAFEMGIPKSALQAEYERLGITPDDSEYDKLTALPDDLQLDEVKAQIDGLTGDDLLASLLSMRVVSEGTRKMLLTDSLINKLEDEGIISKDQGKLLESMTWNGKTKTFEKKPGSGSGSAKKPAKVTLSKVIETPKLRLPSVSSGGSPISSVKLPKLSTNLDSIPKPPRLQVRAPQRLTANSLVKLRTPVKSIYSLGRVS